MLRWRREKRREREEKCAVSLKPASTQEPRHFVRYTIGICIYGEELNHYTSRLKDGLQRFLQPASD